MVDLAAKQESAVGFLLDQLLVWQDMAPFEVIGAPTCHPDLNGDSRVAKPDVFVIFDLSQDLGAGHKGLAQQPHAIIAGEYAG